MLPNIGAPELILVLVLVLILFGAGRLPQVFEQFGRGMRAFRDAQKEEPIDVTRATSVDDRAVDDKDVDDKKRPQLTEDELHDAEEVKEKAKVRNG